MTQETDEIFTFVQIPDVWEPVDAESGQQRGLFLCHALDGQIRQNLLVLIAKCKDGAFGKEIQQAVHHNLNEWAVAAAIKEATCACIHRAWLEQGGEEAAAWLLDFVLLSYQEADAITGEPESVAIIEKCEQVPIAAIIPDLIVGIAGDFGIPLESEAGLMLQNLLESSSEIARELLLLSLSQPPESLYRHLQMYQR